MSTDVEKVKDRLGIVDVVSRYTKIQKSGKNWRGLSPFKKEKTPSFFVSPDKGMYYDFSSGQGGDIFTFVQKMEGVDFGGALKILAELAGVTLTGGQSHESRDERERHYALMEEACVFYEARMTDEARGYLEQRGLSEESITGWRLGFAPESKAGESASWTHARDHLRAQGYGDAEIELLGIAKRGEKSGFYDRFRSRIMFPIFDTAGRVIAFSGRIFGAAAEDKEQAKYLNSPETPLFDKSRTLYGYDRAKNAIRSNNFAIFVEGQMDLLMAHQTGYRNTVAVSGTGLTEAHLGLISRLTKNLVLALDADRAGIAASGRAAALALERSMDVKVAALPEGLDPADAILKDPELWKRAIKGAVHVVDFYLAHVDTEPHRDDRARLLAAQTLVLPFIGRIANAVDRAHFIHRFADRYDITEEAVQSEVVRIQREAAREARRTDTPSPHISMGTLASARETQGGNRKEELQRLLAGLIEEARTNGRTSEAEMIEARFLALTEPHVPSSDTEREALLFEAEAFRDMHEHPMEAIEEILDAYETLILKEKLRILAQSARLAEQEGKHDEAEAILREADTVSKCLAALEKKEKTG